MRAMVMAAGRGTRLRPFTEYLPKPLMPVLRRPVIEHLLDQIADSGCAAAAVNLHYRADDLRRVLERYRRLPLEIRIEERLLGTAGGTKGFDAFLRAGGESFMVTSADGFHEVDLAALMERHRESGAMATLTVKAVPDPSQFAIVDLDDGRVTAYREKPPPEEITTDLASVGIYCFRAEVLDLMEPGEFVDWAEDVIPRLLEAGEHVGAYTTSAYWSDIGTVEEFRNANLTALERSERTEPDVDPGATVGAAELVGPVLVGDGAQVEDGVRLAGPLVVGRGSRIGAGSSLEATIVLPGAQVAPGTLLTGGVLGSAPALEHAWD